MSSAGARAENGVEENYRRWTASVSGQRLVLERRSLRPPASLTIPLVRAHARPTPTSYCHEAVPLSWTGEH